MGLVETAAEHASVKSVSFFVVAVLVVHFAVSRINEHIRIRRIGNYGKSLPYWAPLGLSPQRPVN